MILPKSGAALLGLLAIASPAHAIITTVITGVYDESATRANSVDASFANAPTTKSGTGPAPTLLTVGTFTTKVAAAFAAGNGGVMTFDTTPTSASGETTITGTYAPGKTFTITNTSGVGGYTVDMSATAAITATPISGGNYLRLGNPAINFNMSTPVEAFGFTILGRNDARLAAITITYNDGTTASYSGYSVGASGNTSSPFAFSDTSANDTFFGFEAPSGLLITRVAISAGGNNPTIDDIGFIIPEPSAAMLSIIGALGLISRRRRN